MDDSLAINDQLDNYLSVIGHGTFATSGRLSTAANPASNINGLGRVGLPLSDRDAAAIAKVCHEAPFGKGSETRVDHSVRKTWELNPDQYQTRNPAWHGTLYEAVRKAGQDLGVRTGFASIRAVPHKLLLYEPGAFFDTHRE